MQQKIVMVSSGHGPCDDRLYYRETISLSQRSFEIVVVAPEADARTCEDDSIAHVPLITGKTLLSRFMTIPRVVMTVLKLRPDICHVHDFELLFALPILRLLSRARLIYDAYEVYPEMALQSANIPVALRRVVASIVDILERLTARSAHAIITADENIAERFRGSGKPIVTLFNYPRLSLFVPHDESLAVLKERYKNRIPIIYHGSMDENRGLFQMIRAMELVGTIRPEIILLLVGGMDADLLRRAKKEISDRHVEDSVVLIGEVPHEEIVNYITISKLGLVPLLPTEKFKKNIPTKQFEYMACGIPVLGADLPPIASYINASGCGRTYDSTNVRAFAESIIAMLADEEQWQFMSASGRQAVREQWNWGEMEGRLFGLYEQLARNV